METEELVYTEETLFSLITADGHKIGQKTIKNAKEGDSEAIFKIGKVYRNNMDYNKAIIWFKKSAAHNNSEAQNQLGELYYKGRGVAQDYEMAYDWFMKSSEGSNIKAFRNIASIHRNGHGRPENKGWALHYYFQAVENGDIESMLDIGDIYCGWKSWKLALIWYKRAADKGHIKAKEEEKKMHDKNVYLDYNEHALLSLERRVENLIIDKKELEDENKDLKNMVEGLTSQMVECLASQHQRLSERTKKLEDLVARILSDEASSSEQDSTFSIL